MKQIMIKSIRRFWFIVKKCEFDKLLLGFFVCFFVGALIVKAVEPGIERFGDALWYLFVSCTTIGFGDFTSVTFAGRMVTVFIVIYEIVLVAILSGVIVSNYLEVVHRREKYTATVMLDRLEHLSELSPEELKEIEKRVKKVAEDDHRYRPE